MYNFEFVLKSKKESLLPAFTGHLIRGAILDIIKNLDEDLSETLHKGNIIRPYSLSPLFPYEQKLNRTRRGEIIVEKEASLKFRFGILTQELAERMVTISLQKDEMIFQLAKGEFKVVSIEIKKKSAKELLQDKEKPSTRLSLTFLTPTYFNISKQEFPMRYPEPRYLFMNLASLWNAFNEESVKVNQEELFEWVENHISVNAFNLQTRTVYIAKNAPKIGFKGWIRYQLSGSEDYQRWIHALAQFAEFSNIGANRTAGLGCVKYRIKNKY